MTPSRRDTIGPIAGFVALGLSRGGFASLQPALDQELGSRQGFTGRTASEALRAVVLLPPGSDLPAAAACRRSCPEGVDVVARRSSCW